MLFSLLLTAAAPAAILPSHSCPGNTTTRQSINPHIIVQGGTHPNLDPASKIAIGPKQDDPAQPPPKGVRAVDGYTSRTAASGTGLIAIGPKQDDPAQPTPPPSIASCSATH